jgi:hypothetical protein
MTNIEIIKDHNEVEHAVITEEDGSFTSMPKSVYDELKANEAAAK